jgi:hypothetical protein
LEEIHDDLVRIEGSGACGGGEFMNAFTLHVKAFEMIMY